MTFSKLLPSLLLKLAAVAQIVVSATSEARQILSNLQFWMCFLLVAKETRLLCFDWLAQNGASLLNQFGSTWKRLQWIVRRISRQWWNLPLLGKISESVVNFDWKDEILWCEYSNETSSTVLLLSVMWYLVFWKWNFELFLKFYFEHCATTTGSILMVTYLILSRYQQLELHAK